MTRDPLPKPRQTEMVERSHGRFYLRENPLLVARVIGIRRLYG